MADSNSSPSLAALYAQTSCWHGTGRHKYDEHGEVVDVLAKIIADGGIVPHKDDWDLKRGVVQSISLGKQRMYARLYAGMFVPHGTQIRYEYRSRYLWCWYFFGTAKLIALLEYPLRAHTPNYRKRVAQWARKVSLNPHNSLSIFINGTDIAGNYPILIGVRQGAVQYQYGSHFFNLHERRTTSPICFADMTHIEVPRERAAETRAKLQAHTINVPVFALEDGEDYCRRFSFWQLVNGKPLALPA